MNYWIERWRRSKINETSFKIFYSRDIKRNIGWLRILSLFDEKFIQTNKVVYTFIKSYRRSVVIVCVVEVIVLKFHIKKSRSLDEKKIVRKGLVWEYFNRNTLYTIFAEISIRRCVKNTFIVFFLILFIKKKLCSNLVLLNIFSRFVVIKSTALYLNNYIK